MDLAEQQLSQAEQIEKALRICGAKDYSDNGEQASVILTGDFAKAVITRWFTSEQHRETQGLDGEPIRLSRSGHLEVWCNGVYTEGQGIRNLIHDAVDATTGQGT